MALIAHKGAGIAASTAVIVKTFTIAATFSLRSEPIQFCFNMPLRPCCPKPVGLNGGSRKRNFERIAFNGADTHVLIVLIGDLC
jgi:hypothetical protein